MDSSDRISTEVAFQNPYLEVRQPDFLNVRKIFFKRTPQGMVQRGDRTITLGYGVPYLILNLELDRGFRTRLLPARFTADSHMVAQYLESEIFTPQKSAKEKIEGSIGSLEFISLEFQTLELLEKGLHLR